MKFRSKRMVDSPGLSSLQIMILLLRGSFSINNGFLCGQILHHTFGQCMYMCIISIHSRRLCSWIHNNIDDNNKYKLYERKNYAIEVRLLSKQLCLNVIG
jgi:hypothetical protein